ncbi:MAG: FtsQ-type POTRA domain-containing protein [Woeseiaceae bacterium]|nr:FtsQ-type POTRA domain-containing protein [Woeseiaceae bacterium]
MARKQAQRRKKKSAPKVSLPRIPIGRFLKPMLAALVVVGTYEMSARMLDSDIESLSVNGPFQRVTALQIEEAVSNELDAGFLGADLGRMRELIQALPWIDQAAVARRWPNRIAITVTEQVPAAMWDENGLLNVRGELFVENARHIPAELPRLSGPKERAADVARSYLAIRDRLIPIGLDVRSIELDPRGAWQLSLSNGIEVRLGRRDVAKRTDLFVDVVANVITGRAADISYVDMRYSNGFTIGWKDGANTPITDPENAEREMLAYRDAN